MSIDIHNPESHAPGSLLDRLDSLPSPSPVAMRLLCLLDDESSCTEEIVELISSDPALAAKVMNNSFNVRAYQEKVGADTEAIFSDGFYEHITGVCTALDNVEARL